MVAIKTGQAESLLANPPNSTFAFLFYGGDPGLIGERATRLARSLAGLDRPPNEILRIEDSDLEQDPGRLDVELRTVAMFGGRKIVRTQASRRVTGASLKALLEAGRLEGWLIVEAGSLKPDDSLRALFEKHATAAAVACFGDTERDIEALISEVLRTHKLDIAPDARAALAARLGADRALSRAEIEKLALYASGNQRITVEDVEACVGDVSEYAIDRVIASAIAGRLDAALGDCDRTLASGESAHAIIAAAQRHCLKLHRVKMAIEAGKSLDDALRGLRPPLQYQQRDRFAADLRAWSAASLSRALARIADAQRATRTTGAMEDVIAERLLMELAFLATSGKRAAGTR